MDKTCKKEMKNFLHQNFYESLTSLKKTVFVNVLLIQTRKLVFFEKIDFINRNVWENNSEIELFCKKARH